MTLGQIGHIGFPKAYVGNFDAQKNVRPMMDKFLINTFFWWVQRWVVDTLFNFPKFFEDVVDIIKSVESNPANDSQRTLRGASQQTGLSQNIP